MVRQATVIGLLAGLAVPASAIAGEPRRERAVDFELDDAFQADGGVQIFFELVGAPATATPGSTLERFQVLDRTNRLGALTEPVHVVLARISYLVEKDSSFFTRQRLLDVTYVQAIAPDMDITSVADGGFQVGQAPRNRFSLDFHADASTVPPGIVSLARARGAPVLNQENVDFARIMGWRTADWSTTWTFHESLGPRRTRVTVLTMSYLFNLPPFFVGGGDRVYADTLARTQAIIARLRDYSEPPRR